jgi:imidazolonepropionase
MASRLIVNISELLNIREGSRPLRGKDLSLLPALKRAWLLIEDEEIVSCGNMDELDPSLKEKVSASTDAKNGMVLPCWCDSHTHLVFEGSRENEFVDKIRGKTYAEINAGGGGILNTARNINESSEDQLFGSAWKRLEEISRLGTGAVEIKSGYGLTVDNELKMLRVIRKLKERSPLFIRSTFLGAHSYPEAYRENHQGYIDLIINQMLPAIAREKLADYMDVFCEQGFFSAEETDILCRAGLQYGLRPRLHVNQLSSCGGIEAGIRHGAVSLDHLEMLTPGDIALLSGKFSGLATVLPTAAYFLRMPFPPARELIDSGCALALASDYNPGSSPGGNMNLVVSMACIQMKMLPEEAINAATLNGAHALELGDRLGSIAAGKTANLILTKPIPSTAYLPYAFGSNLIDRVMIRGQFISD